MKASDSKTSIECPVCRKKMRSITTQHIRTHGWSTAAEFKKHFGLASLKCEDMRRAQSDFLKANNPTKDVGHSAKAKVRMREARKGKGLGVCGQYERTPEIRRKIAEGVLNAWEKGKRGRGQYVFCRKANQKVWVRSTWEARVVFILDRHPCVASVEVEPFRIPYTWEGQQHLYVPDFHILLEGQINEVWEIKPKRLLGSNRNQAKLAALNHFVSSKGWNARMVHLRHIREMERQVGLAAWEGPGGPWVDLANPDFRPRSPQEQKGFFDED